MRILLVHNYYGSSAPSGENQVFEAEKALLERHGHEVRTLVRHSDELREAGALGLVKGALVTAWNPFTAGRVRRALDGFPADVVHAHNTFPLLSPSLFPAVGGRAARVLTLHNYRIFCPAGIPSRGGAPCTLCLDRRSALPSLRHACYRGSRLATLPLAAGVALQRALRLWERHVEAFIVLSEFQRDLMVRSGLPGDRVWVKPNFYPGSPVQVPWAARRASAVFAGRLSAEKGVTHLLEAWRAWGDQAPELRVLGDGPLRPELQAQAAGLGARVTFLGQVPPAVAEAEIARARLLVLPSVCFEGFPMVLREAFAFGTPAAVSDLGPLPDLVGQGTAGLVFRAADPSSLLRAVREAWEAPGALEARGAAARRAFEERYGEAGNLATLIDVYRRAVSRRHGAAA